MNWYALPFIKWCILHEVKSEVPYYGYCFVIFYFGSHAAEMLWRNTNKSRYLGPQIWDPWKLKLDLWKLWGLIPLHSMPFIQETISPFPREQIKSQVFLSQYYSKGKDRVSLKICWNDTCTFLLYNYNGNNLITNTKGVNCCTDTVHIPLNLSFCPVEVIWCRYRYRLLEYT